MLSTLKPVERLQLALIAMVVAVDLALLWRGPMTMSVADAMTPLAGGLLALGIGLYYRHARGEEKLAMALIGTAFLIWFSCSIATLNYLALSFDRPLIDGMLAGWDQAIGIDWPKLFVALKTMPLLGTLLTAAYISTLLQVAVAVPTLALLGRTAHLDRFFLAFILAATVTIGFWAAYPSFGAAYHHVIGGQVTALPGAFTDVAYAKSLQALKAGTYPHIVLGEMKGLIAFPSFHTVMAALTVYAAAAVPRAFWPAVIWNALVLLSVPVDGGHHVVDVPAGLLLAAAALAAADAICRKLPAFAPGRLAGQGPTATAVQPA